MDQRVEAIGGHRAGEGDVSELLPIDLAVRPHNRVPVLLPQRLMACLPRPVEPGHHCICIDDHAAQSGQRAADARLSGGNPSGQADAKDHRRLHCAAVTVFFMSMAIVIGPTPPGTGVIHSATSRTRL